MIEHPREAASLIFERPTADEILYEQVKDGVICRRDGAPHAGSAILDVALVCKMPRILQKVVS
jgi:hypothetical protein